MSKNLINPVENEDFGEARSSPSELRPASPAGPDGPRTVPDGHRPDPPLPPPPSGGGGGFRKVLPSGPSRPSRPSGPSRPFRLQGSRGGARGGHRTTVVRWPLATLEAPKRPWWLVTCGGTHDGPPRRTVVPSPLTISRACIISGLMISQRHWRARSRSQPRHIIMKDTQTQLNAWYSFILLTFSAASGPFRDPRWMTWLISDLIIQCVREQVLLFLRAKTFSFRKPFRSEGFLVQSFFASPARPILS